MIGNLKHPTDAMLNNMSKTRSSTWEISAQRWLRIICEGLKSQDVKTVEGQKTLQQWKLKNILQGGDKIFRGVI